MRRARILILALMTAMAATSAASAQTVRGFVSGGMIADVNQQRFPSAGGGVVVNLGAPWLSAGVQAETFWQWPYFAGRGTLFGEIDLVPKGRFRPFLLGGRGFGETAGPMFGAGVELLPGNTRVGLRVSAEDYVARIRGLDCGSFGLQSYCNENPRAARGYVAHQVTLRAAVLF